MNTQQLLAKIAELHEEAGEDRTSIRILAMTEDGSERMWLDLTDVTRAEFRDGGDVAHALFILAEPMYPNQSIHINKE